MRHSIKAAVGALAFALAATGPALAYNPCWPDLVSTTSPWNKLCSGEEDVAAAGTELANYGPIINHVIA